MARLSGAEEVAAYFDGLDHPLKPVMETVRDVILNTDNDITEHIKWKSPSYCHNGDDRITFNLHRDGSVMLIFHRGAKVKTPKGPGRLVDDPTGRLEWHADDRASLRLTSVEDLDDVRPKLTELVRLWIAAA